MVTMLSLLMNLDERGHFIFFIPTKKEKQQRLEGKHEGLDYHQSALFCRDTTFNETMALV